MSSLEHPRSFPGRKVNRRQFLGFSGATALTLLAEHSAANESTASPLRTGEFAFLEAEGFTLQGGWELDQQSMDQMGSPYLLAHGLGIPVEDAVTTVTFPTAGIYRVWVRTRDWVAPWNAPGSPGKFQVLIDGKAIGETFGTKGAEWHWHDGGTVAVRSEATVALHDLTGFDGRCEAILFCKDVDFQPSHDVAATFEIPQQAAGSARSSRGRRRIRSGRCGRGAGWHLRGSVSRPPRIIRGSGPGSTRPGRQWQFRSPRLAAR